MKQRRNQDMVVNAHIGPWLPTIPKKNHNLLDVKESISTNAAIVNDFVRREKLFRLGSLNEKITGTSNSKTTPQYLNKLKNSTSFASEFIQNNTKEELKESRKSIGKFTKSIKEIITRNQHSKEKDLELLTKLAELKQNGIITQKEFNSKKKKILANL